MQYKPTSMGITPTRWCYARLQKLLRDNLDMYFVDTLISMEHSVQIVPVVEYYARWVLEYATQCWLCCCVLVKKRTRIACVFLSNSSNQSQTCGKADALCKCCI